MEEYNNLTIGELKTIFSDILKNEVVHQIAPRFKSTDSIFISNENISIPEELLEKLFAPDVTALVLEAPKSDYFYDLEDSDYSLFKNGYKNSCSMIYHIMLERVANSKDKEEIISILKTFITSIGEMEYADAQPFKVSNLEYMEFNKENPSFILFDEEGKRLFYTKETWKEYANAFMSKYGKPKQAYPLFELPLSDVDLFLTICPECGNNLKLGASWDDTFSEYDYTINCPCGKTSYSFSSYYN